MCTIRTPRSFVFQALTFASSACNFFTYLHFLLFSALFAACFFFLQQNSRNVSTLCYAFRFNFLAALNNWIRIQSWRRARATECEHCSTWRPFRERMRHDMPVIFALFSIFWLMLLQPWPFFVPITCRNTCYPFRLWPLVSCVACHLDVFCFGSGVTWNFSFQCTRMWPQPLRCKNARARFECLWGDASTTHFTFPLFTILIINSNKCWF